MQRAKRSLQTPYSHACKCDNHAGLYLGLSLASVITTLLFGVASVIDNHTDLYLDLSLASVITALFHIRVCHVLASVIATLFYMWVGIWIDQLQV